MRYLPGFAVIIMSFMFFGTIAYAKSDWPKNKYSEIKVLHSPYLSETTKNKYMVGLHIKMRKKWKTYWRQPGDAGIPPFFSWKGSENIKSVKVLWPAPLRMVDPYVTTIGYEEEVVFPIVFEAKDDSKPIQAKLNFSYGVCKDICIPEERKVNFAVPVRGSSSAKDHMLLSKFFKQVPTITRKSDEKNYQVRKAPVIRNLKMELSSKKPQISFSVIYPPKTKRYDLFVEASGGYFITEPKKGKSYEWKRDGSEGEQVLGTVVEYMIDLTKGDKPTALKGRTVTATMVSDVAQSQTSWVVE